VTITFASYDLEAVVQSFGDWLVGSTWLTTVGEEYGIGAGTHLKKVVMPDQAPSQVSQLDIIAFIDQKARGGTIPAPSSGDSNLIYVVYYPASTTINLVDSQGNILLQSCVLDGFAGIHFHGLVDGVDAPIAALPECSSLTAGTGLTTAEFTELYASHEIIEAATDPFPDTSPGYQLDPNDPWAALGREIGDLCVDNAMPPTPEGFRAQRIWSNAAALRGGSPCIPFDSGDLYYNVSPTPAGPLQIQAGQSTDVEVAGWSTLQGTTWLLSAGSSGTFSPILTPQLAGLFTETMNDCSTFRLHVGIPLLTPTGSKAVVLLFSHSGAEPFTFSFWPISIEVL
jgi:hypothetical protein